MPGRGSVHICIGALTCLMPGTQRLSNHGLLSSHYSETLERIPALYACSIMSAAGHNLRCRRVSVPLFTLRSHELYEMRVSIKMQQVGARAGHFEHQEHS